MFSFNHTLLGLLGSRRYDATLTGFPGPSVLSWVSVFAGEASRLPRNTGGTMRRLSRVIYTTGLSRNIVEAFSELRNRGVLNIFAHSPPLPLLSLPPIPPHTHTQDRVTSAVRRALRLCFRERLMVYTTHDSLRIVPPVFYTVARHPATKTLTRERACGLGKSLWVASYLVPPNRANPYG